MNALSGKPEPSCAQDGVPLICTTKKRAEVGQGTWCEILGSAAVLIAYVITQRPVEVRRDALPAVAGLAVASQAPVTTLEPLARVWICGGVTLWLVCPSGWLYEQFELLLS